VQCDRLVIAHIAPAFAFAREELWVEAPGDDRVYNDIIVAVDVEFFGDHEELSVSAVRACAANSVST
jgi:hypothetical protein